MDRSTQNAVIETVARLLEMTGQASAILSGLPEENRTVVRFYPVGAMAGRTASLAVVGDGFSVARFDGNDEFVDEKGTRSMKELPDLLSRAFTWSRTRVSRNGRRTSRSRR